MYNSFKTLQLQVKQNIVYRCAELGEYCLREKFEADCSGPMPTTSATALLTARSGTIVEGRILMRSAQYGRPHLGRCVQRHFHGFQGCVVDVLHTVDRLCSGRPRCSVDVFQTFGSLKPCSEIESYLEADFICVPGNIPLEFRGNYSATSNNMILAHWPLTGGLLHFIQRGGDWAGPQPAQAHHRCTKCNSPPINVQYSNFMLFDVAL